MAGHFFCRCWYVRQLQGSSGIAVPRDLDWTICFVAACQRLARAQRCNQVRLARASELASYRYPGVRVSKGESAEEAIARIRKKMLIHYDETARRLGFMSKGRWAVWRPE